MRISKDDLIIKCIKNKKTFENVVLNILTICIGSCENIWKKNHEKIMKKFNFENFCIL